MAVRVVSPLTCPNVLAVQQVYLACLHHDNMFRAVLLSTLMPGGTYRCSVGGASSSAHHAHGFDLRWSVRCPNRGISHPRPRRTAIVRSRGVLRDHYCMILYVSGDVFTCRGSLLYLLTSSYSRFAYLCRSAAKISA